jgi:hypothetical protein
VDCLQLTGAALYTCSPGAANVTTCVENTCNRVTNCGGAGNKNSLLASAGVPSQATAGIQNLSIYNAKLNSEYSAYLLASNSINESSIGTELSIMQGADANVSKYSGILSINPLLSPPANYNGTCPSPAGSGPFPCDAIGYCPMNTTIGFNFTLLIKINAQIAALQSLPITTANINAAAKSVNSTADALEDPIEYSHEMALFNQTLSQPAAAYANVSANISALSSHYSNALLTKALASLSAAYNTIQLSGVNQNFTTANRTLSSAVANAAASYALVSAPYLKVYDTAVNNTDMILINELDYSPASVPASVLSLAAAETAVNQQLAAQQLNYTQVAALLPTVLQISGQAKGLSQPFSWAGLVKWTYGSFINAVLAGSSQPVSSKLASAPVYAGLLDFLIGLIIVAVIYEFTYARLKKHGKLKLTPQVRRAWTIIFIVLIALAAICAYLAYSYAQQANGSLPVSGFTGFLSSQNAVFVGLTSSDNSIAQCATVLQDALKAQGKSAYVVPMAAGGASNSSYACTYPSIGSVAGNSITGSACYNKIIASSPLIMLSQSINSSISYRGMYGYVLYVNGSFASGPSCPIRTMIQNA